MKELRTSLLAAIKMDRNMFAKAKIDPMFDSVRPEVDALLGDISQRTKANAEKEIAGAEFAVQRMKKWFDGNYESSDDRQKYWSIYNKISDAKGKIKTQSYFGYDDALKIMSGYKEMVDEIQASIIPHVKSSNSLNHISNNILNLNKKIKQGYIIRISISLGLLFILIISVEMSMAFLTSLYLICFFSIKHLDEEIYVGMALWYALVVLVGGILLLWIIDGIIGFIFGEDTVAVIEGVISFLFVAYSILWPFVPDKATKSEISHLEWLKQKITAADESLL